MQCLNHMVSNAMQHAPRCLEYMQQLRNPQVFSFCAIPQIMAIATLAMCYDNGEVFEGVVKMRRGQTACVRYHWHLSSKPENLNRRSASWSSLSSIEGSHLSCNAQVFDRLSSMGSLYQQFHEWAALLQGKAREAHARGDPTAEQTLQHLEPTLEACREGVQEHGVPLCALLHNPRLSLGPYGTSSAMRTIACMCCS